MANALLKKTIKIFIIKVRKKKKRTITLIPPLNLPFNPIEFKSIRIHIIIIKNLKETNLIDLIKSEIKVIVRSFFLYILIVKVSIIFFNKTLIITLFFFL